MVICNPVAKQIDIGVFPQCPLAFRTDSTVSMLSASHKVAIYGYTAGCSSCLIKYCSSMNNMAELQLGDSSRTASVPSKEVSVLNHRVKESSMLRQMQKTYILRLL